MKVRSVSLVVLAVGLVPIASPAAGASTWPTTATRLVLPSHRLTPGAVNPRFTAEDSCLVPHRGPSVSTAVRKEVLARYAVAWSRRAMYQIDWLVPPSIGGTSSLKNLWPEPLSGRYGARAKDAADSHVDELVCEGNASLRTAQHLVAVDWYTATAHLSSLTRKPVQPPARPPVVPPPTTPAPVPPTPPSGGFGDGTHLVPSQMPIGTYVAPGGAFCYWERDKDFQGVAGSINANDIGPTRPAVTLSAADVGFQSSNCGTWVPYTAPASPVTTFAAGTWFVNTDIVAGTYTAPGGDSCYWERLSDVSGSDAGIIANDIGATNPVVTVAPADLAFKSDACGAWTRIGP